jgi:hypothetical protein
MGIYFNKKNDKSNVEKYLGGKL